MMGNAMPDQNRRYLWTTGLQKNKREVNTTKEKAVNTENTANHKTTRRERTKLKLSQLRQVCVFVVVKERLSGSNLACQIFGDLSNVSIW